MTLQIPELDPVFHQPVRTRLALAIYLKPVRFKDLRQSLNVTDGNLDGHLKKLSAAGYLHSEMVLEGRPATAYSLSPSGREAFEIYLSQISGIVDLAR